jgi:hypothetical protein
MARVLMVIGLLLTFTTTLAQTSYVPPMAMTMVESPLYAAPDGESVGALPALTAVFIEGRDGAGEWMLVRVIDDSASGWIASLDLLLSADVTVSNLPVRTAPSSVESQPVRFDLSTDEGRMARLQSIPVLFNMATPQIRQIFAHGQSLGNRANVFVKVGDSNTRSGGFLRPLGMGARGNCDLGSYAYLQETIDFFSVPPRAEFPNSFDSASMTAQDGLGTPGLLDSLRATDPLCKPDESPLECEYRLVKPSVAVIMIGMMDMKAKALDNYRTNLDRILQISAGHGVIPVLTTYSVLPDAINPAAPMWDDHVEMNLIMIEAAERHGIPLINLWLPLQSLPDYGIGPDRSHLKHQLGSFCSFTGAEQQIGGTLRNLLTLQALDELRKNVLTIR